MILSQDRQYSKEEIMRSVLIELLLQWILQKKMKNKLMSGDYEDAVGRERCAVLR